MHITKKKLALISAVAVLAIAVIAIAFYSIFFTPINRDYRTDKYNLYIRSSDTRQSVIDSLKQNNCRVFGLRILTGLDNRKRSDSVKSTFPAGLYVISEQNARTLFNTLKLGNQQPVNVLINSCRTISQMAQQLSRQLLLDSITVDSAMRSASFLKKYGCTPETVYSLIIPNTYQMYWSCTLDELFTRLQRENARFWTPERVGKAEDINLTPDQVVTLASIVQEESSLSKEWPVIAGLYLNRLRKNIALQACPTVLFIVPGPRPTRVLQKHLEIKSPYNTYIHRGLPPGPIRFVNINVIDAVLDYSHHNYYYMCASSNFDGTHVFTSTLEQHNLYAKKYQRAYNKLYSTTRK